MLSVEIALSKGSDIHEYNTRRGERLRSIGAASMKFGGRSLINKAIKYFNQTPPSWLQNSLTEIKHRLCNLFS